MNWSTVIRECARWDQACGFAGCVLLALALPFVAVLV